MKKIVNLLLPILMVAEPVLAAGRIQQQDIKSSADCTAAGASLSACLPTDAQIWVTGVTPNQQLSTAISTGAIGGSSGSKNYLSTYKGNTGNGNFEQGATTGWSLGHVALTNGLPSGTPTFGSGASGTQSISVVSSGQLAGSYSLSYANTAATTAGDMVCSAAFATDVEDQAKVQTLKAYYSPTVNASNMNFSGTSSNSYGVAVYDVTNSAWISTVGAFGFTQSTGVGYVTATAQTNATTASMRVCVYNVSATTGAATILLDDISFGPQTAPLGPAMSDWVSYTPTGTFTTGTYTGKWRRVGDSMQVSSTFVASGSNSGTFSISIPSGYSIDTSKFTSSNSGYITEMIGHAEANQSGQYPGSIRYASATTINVAQYSSSPVTEPALWSGTVPFTPASGATYTANFQVPIIGWSSNAVQSSDNLTQVVSATANTLSTTTITSGTPLIFTVVAADKTGSYSTSTGNYTCPVSGLYQVTVFLQAAASNSGAFWVSKNGATYTASSASTRIVDIDGSRGGSGAMTITCNAGDTLNISPNWSGSFGGTSGNVSFTRIAGPAVVQATESVNGHWNSSTSSISGTQANVTYNSKDFDTHGAFNGTTLTIPVSGKYQLNARLATTDVSGSHMLSLYMLKNGSTFTQTSVASVGAGVFVDIQLNDIFFFNAGDLVTVQASDSGGTPSIISSSTRNNFSWARVGN